MTICNYGPPSPPKLTAEELLERFGPRIEAKLKEIAAGIPACTPAEDVCLETGGEEYEWYLTAPSFYVRIEIAEAATYGEEGGYNFTMMIVGEGGKVYGQLTPYNYTKRVWTEDMEELEERWSGWFAPVTADEILSLVKEEVRHDS